MLGCPCRVALLLLGHVATWPRATWPSATQPSATVAEPHMPGATWPGATVAERHMAERHMAERHMAERHMAGSHHYPSWRTETTGGEAMDNLGGDRGDSPRASGSLRDLVLRGPGAILRRGLPPRSPPGCPQPHHLEVAARVRLTQFARRLDETRSRGTRRGCSGDWPPGQGARPPSSQILALLRCPPGISHLRFGCRIATSVS